MDAMMMDAMAKDMRAMPDMADLDMSVMQTAMDALSACEQACTVCSTQMMSCATACMNCADMCNTTMRAMMRMQGMTRPAMIAMLDACIEMCRMCMEACTDHADHSEICRMCAQSCQACMDACMAVKQMLMA